MHCAYIAVAFVHFVFYPPRAKSREVGRSWRLRSNYWPNFSDFYRQSCHTYQADAWIFSALDRPSPWRYWSLRDLTPSNNNQLKTRSHNASRNEINQMSRILILTTIIVQDAIYQRAKFGEHICQTLRTVGSPKNPLITVHFAPRSLLQSQAWTNATELLIPFLSNFALDVSDFHRQSAHI